MHDAITVGIPVLAVLFAAYWNNSGLKDLRADMKADIGRVEAEVHMISSDLRQFYKDTGKLEGRLDTLEKRVR